MILRRLLDWLQDYDRHCEDCVYFIHTSAMAACSHPTNTTLIRQLWGMRWMGIKQWELAEMFNISGPNVCSIVSRKTWKHI